MLLIKLIMLIISQTIEVHSELEPLRAEFDTSINTDDKIIEVTTAKYETKKYLKFIDNIEEYEELSGNTNPARYCPTLRTCFECTKSIVSCEWHHNYGCMSTRDDTQVSKVENEVTCPYIKYDGNILAPVGIQTYITVKIFKPESAITKNHDVTCHIKLKNRETHLRAYVADSMVHCYHIKFDETEFDEVEFGVFKLFWGGHDPLSNEIPIVVYNCRTMAYDCEACKSIPFEYGCGWCDGTNKCVTDDKCFNSENWALNRISCYGDGRRMIFV